MTIEDVEEYVTGHNIRHFSLPGAEIVLCGKWIPKITVVPNEKTRDCMRCTKVRAGQYHNSAAIDYRERYR